MMTGMNPYAGVSTSTFRQIGNVSPYSSELGGVLGLTNVASSSGAHGGTSSYSAAWNQLRDPSGWNQYNSPSVSNQWNQYGGPSNSGSAWSQFDRPSSLSGWNRGTAAFGPSTGAGSTGFKRSPQVPIESTRFSPEEPVEESTTYASVRKNRSRSSTQASGARP